MSELQRERDLVLNPNEFAYVLDKTKGLISCVVGSYKMSLSTSDALVIFNEKTKRFEEASFQEAITTFVSAPENWYVTLKNPAKEDKHPIAGTANPLPELQIGKKVNIKGNVSFALYPGQMAKAIQGHRLHSNQYLLARVYDAEALENQYTIGQLLVIKGTEVSFYIPPTGIEVIPIDEKGGRYIRDAVTLERLEYCILKDEQGNKQYIHGAAVVFPEPDETFVENPNGGYKFRAIELSEISGIYVKVIADYEEGNRQYKTGEELFITGKEQMIYYPRPEHAIIDYNGQVLHHAIAIPVGEGRYVLDWKTGNIKTIRGAAMYLPDPRKEVIVRRKLTEKQCRLWYPGNAEVLRHNLGMEHTMPAAIEENSKRSGNEKKNRPEQGLRGVGNMAVGDSGFSRNAVYPELNAVTIDNKYNGAISVDIWTGYAINVVSKNGERKVILGAQTYLMEYDETLESMELSTGRPKTTDHLLSTVYLRVENNKISDVVKVQTKDFVDVQIKVSYCVDFLPEYKEKWFSVENYVKYLTDRERSLIKRAAKLYTIEAFYENAADIVRKVALNLSDEKEKPDSKPTRKGRFFPENGMLAHDVEILSVSVQEDVKDILHAHQKKMIKESLELSNASKEMAAAGRLAEVDKAMAEFEYQKQMYRLELSSRLEKEEMEKKEESKRFEEEARLAALTAEQNLQSVKTAIQNMEIARQKEKMETEFTHKKEMDALEMERQKAYTDSIQRVIESVSPELIASMTSVSNAELLKAVAESISPYALAGGESVADVTDKLLRGTSLEGMLGKFYHVDS